MPVDVAILLSGFEEGLLLRFAAGSNAVEDRFSLANELPRSDGS
jgi:hypothetical protein